LTGKPDPWQPHRDRLRGFTIVDPTPRMAAYAKERGVDSLFQNQGHYTPAGYRLVAEALAEALVRSRDAR
jgi:lysophospholipase L1-like esterase